MLRELRDLPGEPTVIDTDCPYYSDTRCLVASRLIGHEVHVLDERTCAVCTEQQHARDANNVTASIALATLKPRSAAYKEAMKALGKYLKSIERHGPGDELSKLLRWVGFKPTGKGCHCTEHAIEMNTRGTSWCENNKPLIMEWLKEEAERRGFSWVFEKHSVEWLVNLAISRAKAWELKQARTA